MVGLHRYRLVSLEKQMAATIVWFRKDLRLEDNPAWSKAMSLGQPVLPLYVYDRGSEVDWAPGGASRWWQHHALKDLDCELRRLGGNLVVLEGDSVEVLDRLVKSHGVEHLFWNRRYEAAAVSLDSGVERYFNGTGLNLWSGNASLLFEPWDVETQGGTPFKVYTPFRNACEKRPLKSPMVADNGTFRMCPSSSQDLEDFRLLPKLDWADSFAEGWDPTRRGGLNRLDQFLGKAVGAYKTGRDIPSRDGTSRLSPYLSWGQIGVREIAARLRGLKENESVQTFRDELIWREFAYHVLFNFPETPTKPLQSKYDRFPWKKNTAYLRAWQQGKTGYPIVDAGMRQLWQKGWMHNRVRMIVGSLLVKHLLQPWQDGAKWFWDCLVDADLASNTLGWQWAGGCGADAAPYFRVFNPILQGGKFDANGEYVREFVPELAKLPNKFIHQPWEAPLAVLETASLRLGKDYPFPIIDHGEGRKRALEALASLNKP